MPNDVLTTRELWAVAVGIFLPLLIALPLRPTWPNWLRALIGVGFIVVAAIGTSYFAGTVKLDGVNAILRSVLLVAVASWSSYNGLWRHTITPIIEHTLSPGPEMQPH